MSNETPNFQVGDFVVCTEDTKYYCYEGRPYKVRVVMEADIRVYDNDYWHPISHFEPLNFKCNDQVLGWLERYRDGHILQSTKEWQEVSRVIEEMRSGKV